MSERKKRLDIFRVEPAVTDENSFAVFDLLAVARIIVRKRANLPSALKMSPEVCPTARRFRAKCRRSRFRLPDRNKMPEDRRELFDPIAHQNRRARSHHDDRFRIRFRDCAINSILFFRQIESRAVARFGLDGIGKSGENYRQISPIFRRFRRFFHDVFFEQSPAQNEIGVSDDFRNARRGFFAVHRLSIR